MTEGQRQCVLTWLGCWLLRCDCRLPVRSCVGYLLVTWSVRVLSLSDLIRHNAMSCCMWPMHACVCVAVSGRLSWDTLVCTVREPPK